jgi:hypothetical protein
LIEVTIDPISDILYARTMQLNNSTNPTIIAYFEVVADKSPKPTVIMIVVAQYKDQIY